ncbi:HAMP domain-containing sensor histidine kinase [Streptomyces sp. BE20]|uniref:sensor histidine kinase n=1 Tax=Streptomycetaceae TaxID=2062 RepID=UPI002E76CC5E|nr:MULTISPECIES: HAMP domain-containing sensor histidine kinase [unclassified Streptomyces]MED7950636.1 HAMP domain-containing sensor histidine kinase [Streptomyces sp. BE303]MEE1828213.1 HAMP domain-containing sensor histidine kinase [Streptomyces sp. BE20]
MRRLLLSLPALLRRPSRTLGRLSLRARLLVLVLVLVTTGLVVSDAVVLGTVRVQLVQRLDEQLQRFGEPLAHRAPSRVNWQENKQQSPSPGAKRAAPQYLAALPSQYLVQYLSADGKVQLVVRQPVSENDPAPQLAGLEPAATDPDTPFDLPDQRGRRTWRALVLPLQRPPAQPSMFAAPAPTPAYLMVAVSREDIDGTVARLHTAFVGIGGAVLVLIAALGFFAVRAGLRPLSRIEEGAERIAAGELSHRMPEFDPRTEVGRLSVALNGMLTQIEAAFAARAESEARMRRFVADASHELRTPLAGIRGFAELYRMGALPTEADVKRTMGRIENEAVRMGTLVEDLLVLARLDEERPLDLAPMDLRTLAADALHDLTALDPSRPVALTGPAGTGAPGPAPVLGDEARLRQVVTNLVGNAVKHTPPGTPVRIGVGTDGGLCLLEVADSGPGLTADQAALVFHRFYRVDASRSRPDKRGGAGLGLAIATALTHAHGGTLTLHTAPGAGATFRLELPHQR